MSEVTMNAADMDWEIYDDQDDDVFTHIGYVDLSGTPHFEPIINKLVLQVAEIKRKNGNNTEIRVYRPREV